MKLRERVRFDLAMMRGELRPVHQFRQCPGPRCLTRIPVDRARCWYCQRSETRGTMRRTVTASVTSEHQTPVLEAVTLGDGRHSLPGVTAR